MSTDKLPALPPAVPSSHSRHLIEDPNDFKLATLIAEFEQIRLSHTHVCDFSFGNPHDPPSSTLVDLFHSSLIPKTVDHYAYRANSSRFCRYLATSAAKRYSFESLTADDVFLTTGNFAGIALALHLVAETGDTVIYMEPGWFFYSKLILSARAVPKPIRMPLHDPGVDDLSDMRAFLDAVDDSTKIIILNQPHNPTGKVYSRAWLEEFSDKLTAISRTRGFPLYVLADEAYSDYTFDGIKHNTIASIYPYTILAYTYNKMTLAPSQRAGYLILSPLMPDRETLRIPLFSLQTALTWCFPNATLMESIPALEAMRDKFDASVISKRRDRMQTLLERIGFELLVKPKGSFYMFVKTPIPDDEEFCRLLARRKILALPGSMFNIPEYFRLCLTASDEMIERCVDGFRECFEEVRK